MDTINYKRMKLLKIEKQNDFIYITYEKTYLFFFKKVFTDRIVSVTEYFYATLWKERIAYKSFVLCKNGVKLNKRLNDLLNTLTENLKNGETLNLN